LLFLSNYFIKKYGKKYSSLVEGLPPEVLQAFMAYDWPGNIRQLENVVKRYLLLPGRNLGIGDLKENPFSRPPLSAPNLSDAEPQKAPFNAVKDPCLVERRNQAPFPPAAQCPSLKQVSALAAERAEKEVVLWMLGQTNWNRKLAADRLDICYKAAFE